MSKDYNAAATGMFSVAGQRVEGGAVLHNGQWYAFDADKMRPYGSPLEDFAVETKAVSGALAMVRIAPGSELSNRMFAEYSVKQSRIAGLSRNSQGSTLQRMATSLISATPTVPVTRRSMKFDRSVVPKMVWSRRGFITMGDKHRYWSNMYRAISGSG